MCDDAFEAAIILANAFKLANKKYTSLATRMAEEHWSHKVKRERERRIQQARESK